MEEDVARPVEWLSSTQKDLNALPMRVKRVFGYALYLAQTGGKHEDAKPLRGFSGAGVLEVVERHDGDTYREVYTVRFEEAVYVLHVFQKKATRGIETPQRDIDLIHERLQQAEQKHAAYLEQQAKERTQAQQATGPQPPSRKQKGTQS